MARSTFDLHKIAKEMQNRGISLVFINEQIDFSTPAGKLMFTMLVAIAEFERDLIAIGQLKGVKEQSHKGKTWGVWGRLRKTLRRL